MTAETNQFQITLMWEILDGKGFLKETASLVGPMLKCLSSLQRGILESQFTCTQSVRLHISNKGSCRPLKRTKTSDKTEEE